MNAHGKSVGVWIALARVTEQAWVKRLRPGVFYRSLRELAEDLGDVGQLRSSSTFVGGMAHLTRTGRVRWDVSGVDGSLEVSVLRPGAGGGPPKEVIFFAVEASDEADGEPIVAPDPELVQKARYHGRHVVEAGRILYALTRLPVAQGGISHRRASVAVEMIRAGATGEGRSVPLTPTVLDALLANETRWEGESSSSPSSAQKG